MKTNKLLISLIFGIMLIGLVSAGEQGENIGTYKAGECVALPQVCASCTYSKILSIISPNQTIYNINDLMSKDGAFYNYTFCNTSQLGEYKVSGVFDVDGIDQSFNYVFTITQSGINLDNSLEIIISVISVMILFGFLGVKFLDSTIPHFGYILLGLSGILSITSLFYGSLLSKNLLTSSFYGIQFNLYNVVFFVITVILILSVIFILISYLKHLSSINKQKKYGSDYNPRTNSYE